MNLQGINFKKWIDDNRGSLKPPVGNKLVFKDGEFIVMVVGGPNERTDFHVDQSDEFFHQLEGNMTLRLFVDGHIRDVRIREGEIYLLPAGIPHSPQREDKSVGLVIERRRLDHEMDALQWYCEKCETKLFEEKFKLADIETQFLEVFERYFSSGSDTCKKCGHKNGRKWTNWKHT